MNTYPNRLFLIPNLSDEKYHFGMTNAIDKLIENGFDVSISENDSIILYGTTNHFMFSSNESDYIVALGGDGSFLIGAQTALLVNKPIFGINYGHRGFLCLFDKDEFDLITPENLSNKKIVDNSILELDYKNNTYYSINEFMAAKANFGGSISLGISINKEINLDMRGDGVIVSTPIGSTSYNATCGGHILKRESNEFVVTPILKNSGNLTSTIYKNNKVVTIYNTNPKYKINIYQDGKLIGPLDDEIKIIKSDKILKILK